MEEFFFRGPVDLAVAALLNGVGRPTRLLLHVFVRRALSRSFDQFCFLCFCSGYSLEDFCMVTELSRYNLGVAFFKTLISRSYLINFLITGGFLWLERTVCYSQRLNVVSMPR